MTDWSLRYPKGIMDDVLVKEDKFNFRVDIEVLDMGEHFSM